MPCRERLLRGSSCFKTLSSGVGLVTQEEEKEAAPVDGVVKVEAVVMIGVV